MSEALNLLASASSEALNCESNFIVSQLSAALSGNEFSDDEVDSEEDDINSNRFRFILNSSDKENFNFNSWIVELDIIINRDYSMDSEETKDNFFVIFWNHISQIPSGKSLGKFSFGSIRNKLIEIIFKA